MINIAICDDDIDELTKLVQLLNQYKNEKNFNCHYAIFTNAFDLLATLEKGKRFDIYCLDILMPGFTGIEAAKEIRTFDKTSPLIFFTSSTEYALESYSVRAVNYVIKPTTKEKLFFTLDDILEQQNVYGKDDSIIVKNIDGSIQRILLASLVFVEVIGRNVLYHLSSGKVIECKEAFSTVCENLLKYNYFIRTHRSYLVNMQYIDTIDNQKVMLQSLLLIPIAQGKAREIKQQYLDYQMESV